MRTIARLIRSLALLLFIVSLVRAVDVDTTSWRYGTVRTPALQLRYPADWILVDARTRNPHLARSAQELLAAGQLRKLTFQEVRPADWPGEFTLEVWKAPKGSSLARWFAAHAPRDVTGGSLITDSETARLAGEPALTATVFAFDHEERYWLVRRGGHVIVIHHAGANPNDAGAEDHAALYRAMLDTLRFLPQPRR